MGIKIMLSKSICFKDKFQSHKLDKVKIGRRWGSSQDHERHISSLFHNLLHIWTFRFIADWKIAILKT